MPLFHKRRQTPLSSPVTTATIALAGNPNVGKSTIFNALTGMKQHTGNWTGKTVTGAYGYYKDEDNFYKIVDLPGTYSLSARSAEEKVAQTFLYSGDADAVIVVCDATSLERNLHLALQVIAIHPRVVICLNLMDEAKRKGISVDISLLSKLLGVPVVPAVARNPKSLRQLMDAMSASLEAPPSALPSDTRTPEEAAIARVKASEHICKECVRRSHPPKPERWDRLFTGKWSGYAVMLLLLAVIFWITLMGANYPSDLLSRLFSRIEAGLWSGLTLFHAPLWLKSALVEGVFRVVSWVVAVMLPPMAIFFPFFSLLEDVGYLPRIAYNLDRPFCRCKACGKQALTMCMGFGCNAVGVTGCRIIDSPRERLLAMLTNVFVPCNGRFPILISLITMFFVGTSGSLGATALSSLLLTLVIALGIVATFLSTRILSATLLKGMPSSFTLELPPYRKPQIGQVIVRSVFDRTLFVLGRAVSVAAPAGLILWLAANLSVCGESLLLLSAHFLDPFGHLLGLDGVILIAFLLGFPANEIVIPIIMMAYMATGTIAEPSSLWQLKALLVANGWTAATAISVMLFTLMHWPCSTTLLTIKKESGSWKWTAIAAVLPTIMGILACMIFHSICVLLF